ncbi:LOW QUALITY PROTEIN: Dimer_Tnp_hAT domain-containing protein, partial [Cephalotus follicularis]
VHEILIDRWNKNNTPLHCLAHALNPNNGLMKIPLEFLLTRIGRSIKKEPNALGNIFLTWRSARNKVNMEYAEFVGKNGDFRDFDSFENRYAMDLKAWWVLHGACTPMPQTIALRLLAQPSSSSCAKRNSTYSFVHSMKRNKMTPKRAEDLVYIHSNLRLLSRKSPQYAQGTKMWDIGGDAFDSLEDVGVLEVASLSLDEPEMESIVFLDEVD